MLTKGGEKKRRSVEVRFWAWGFDSGGHSVIMPPTQGVAQLWKLEDTGTLQKTAKECSREKRICLPGRPRAPWGGGSCVCNLRQSQSEAKRWNGAPLKGGKGVFDDLALRAATDA